MQQSNVIFASLIIAYIVFITVRGELPTYIQLLRGGGKQAPAGNVSVGTASGGPIPGLPSLPSLSDELHQADVAQAAAESFNSGY